MGARRAAGQGRFRGWGALLGAAAGLLAACASAQTGGPTLRLATWNIEHLAAADGAGCRPRTAADYAELRAVAELLDADVVAVQEVQNTQALARVFDPAVYDLVVSARRDTGRATCRGSA